MKILKGPVEFEWDQGNRGKNFLKHRVNDEECEEIFFDTKKRVLKDVLHSNHESRYIIIGQTKKQRVLFVVFTIRKHKIRIISARDLNIKERSLYAKT